MSSCRKILQRLLENLSVMEKWTQAHIVPQVHSLLLCFVTYVTNAADHHSHKRVQLLVCVQTHWENLVLLCDLFNTAEENGVNPAGRPYVVLWGCWEPSAHVCGSAQAPALPPLPAASLLLTHPLCRGCQCKSNSRNRKGISFSNVIIRELWLHLISAKWVHPATLLSAPYLQSKIHK